MGDRVSNNAINEKQQGAVELLKGERRTALAQRFKRERRKKIPASHTHIHTHTHTHMHFTSKSLKGIKEPCTNTPYLQL
jgi:hypothetical protein